MQLEKTGIFLIGVGVSALSVLEWVKLINKTLEQIHLARNPHLRPWDPAGDELEDYLRGDGHGEAHMDAGRCRL